MKPRDIIFLIVALILAYYIIGVLWALTFFVIRIAVILIVAYVLYLFLKKAL